MRPAHPGGAASPAVGRRRHELRLWRRAGGTDRALVEPTLAAVRIALRKPARVTLRIFEGIRRGLSGRQEMADQLGLTIETVGRTITHLKEEGVIALLTPYDIVLRRPTALANLAEGSG